MKISKSLPTFIAEQLMYSVNDMAFFIANYTKPPQTSSVSVEVKANSDKLVNFSRNLWREMQKGDGFLTIFKSDERRMKVNDVNGLACVITTGMLKQISNAYVSLMTVNSAAAYSGMDTLPSVKRVVDIIRYIDELGLDAIEFSMRSLRTSHSSLSQWNDADTYTFLSDRYQKESWIQHLKTDYPNYDTSSGSDFPVQVAMAEVNTA